MAGTGWRRIPRDHLNFHLLEQIQADEEGERSETVKIMMMITTMKKMNAGDDCDDESSLSNTGY